MDTVLCHYGAGTSGGCNTSDVPAVEDSIIYGAWLVYPFFPDLCLSLFQGKTNDNVCKCHFPVFLLFDCCQFYQ